MDTHVCNAINSQVSRVSLSMIGTKIVKLGQRTWYNTFPLHCEWSHYGLFMVSAPMHLESGLSATMGA